ncbi:uncharacterized protein [Apostichopus japonicus]|uniref:uncharacterized protein n=1 Tax=Stichopus japonicus TaxID=307972 RepID=UPI003AB53B74
MEFLGERFAALPNLVDEVERVIRDWNESAVGLVQRLVLRIEESVTILRYILSIDIDDQISPDVSRVLNRILDCRRRLDLLSAQHNRADEAENNFRCPTVRLGVGRGRPRYDVTHDHIESQRSIHRDWSGIARVLGISRTTLYRRRQFGMSTVAGSNHSSISDDELDQLLREILRVSPHSGEVVLIGALRGRGIQIQRSRLRQAIRRVDPIGRTLRRSRTIVRRTYSVAGPNELWHLHGNHKLIRWRFVIHGCVDGYSRLITYLRCATDNRSATVLRLFQEATQIYGIPSRVRTDMGVENRDVAQFMIETRGPNRRSIITGLSVHNQRIERLWCEVNQRVNSVFRDSFFSLEENGLLDPLDEDDMFSLHFVYLQVINESLREFVLQYNNHPLRTEHNRSPLQLAFWHTQTF